MKTKEDTRRRGKGSWKVQGKEREEERNEGKLEREFN